MSKGRYTKFWWYLILLCYKNDKTLMKETYKNKFHLLATRILNEATIGNIHRVQV